MPPLTFQDDSFVFRLLIKNHFDSVALTFLSFLFVKALETLTIESFSAQKKHFNSFYGQNNRG